MKQYWDVVSLTLKHWQLHPVVYNMRYKGGHFGADVYACAIRNRLCRLLVFVPLLTSSPWSKIGITYTQVLQMEKVFPITPNQNGSIERKIYAKMLINLRSKISLNLPWLLRGKNFPF